MDMANAYRSIRNVGYNMMIWTDKQYLKFVKAEVHVIGDDVSFLLNKNQHDLELKRLIWLRIMGLMETWSIS